MQETPDTEGTARTRRLATLPDALALGEATLIGTRGAPGSRRALLREADGKVRPVARGDMVGGARVAEVDADALRLHHRDRASRLRLVAAEPMSVSPRPRPRPQAPARLGPQAPARLGPQAPARLGPQAPARLGPRAPARLRMPAAT